MTIPPTDKPVDESDVVTVGVPKSVLNAMLEPSTSIRHSIFSSSRMYCLVVVVPVQLSVVAVVGVPITVTEAAHADGG